MIESSDGSGRDAVLFVVKRWYDFSKFGGYMGNVGLIGVGDVHFVRAAANGKPEVHLS
jgi:hypothetical protein